MSAIEWIGSSQVIRSRWGSSRSAGRRLERRVLDPRLGEPLDHAAIQARLGVHRHGGVAVAALQVDDVDAAEARELADEVVVPAGRRVQLEAQPRVHAEPHLEREEARRVADPDRCHEAHRLGPDGRRRPGARGRSGAGRGPAPRSRTPTGGTGGRCRGSGRPGRGWPGRAASRTRRTCGSRAARRGRPRP